MKNLSNWRSVRLWESSVARDLHKRHWLWLHGWCIGLLVLGLMWATAHMQLLMGSQSLALRYLVTLGVGYLGYLLVLRLWAGVLVGRDEAGLDLPGDIPVPGSGRPVGLDRVQPEAPAFQSGGGGDFGGGGASADFSVAGDSGEVLGEVATGALEVAAGADEGAIVVVPVVAIFLIGLAVLFGAGSLLLLYFGWEALLTVAVELAFSYVSARTAIRVVREGWLSAVVRLTWKPLLGALFCAVLLGATMDYFIPSAYSLPHALMLIKGP
ncbi:hypothetical protein [Caenimonas soli]|uniref:hypothetical protein n=1 Tax=Caenimonas soli TaxID=2735555 RepID=UPI00155342A8|nr:hypothetical protein [Caenimonas soli]NPC55314.1 hypothetical protein [Caenimonas soli]